MNNDISQLSIRKLLSGEAKYTIPMYQRTYAWDEGEITQLIQDVIDYLPERRNYYIGTLVVFERTGGRRSVYETIDGQQRLTTLSLLASYLKNEKKCDVSWYEELAMPISWKGTLQQYAGRLHREHADKQDVRIYDYAETNQPQLNRMWDKRRRGYRAMGYEIKPPETVVLGNGTNLT